MVVNQFDFISRLSSLLDFEGFSLVVDSAVISNIPALVSLVLQAVVSIDVCIGDSHPVPVYRVEFDSSFVTQWQVELEFSYNGPSAVPFYGRFRISDDRIGSVFVSLEFNLLALSWF